MTTIAQLLANGHQPHQTRNTILNSGLNFMFAHRADLESHYIVDIVSIQVVDASDSSVYLDSNKAILDTGCVRSIYMVSDISFGRLMDRISSLNFGIMKQSGVGPGWVPLMSIFADPFHPFAIQLTTHISRLRLSKTAIDINLTGSQVNALIHAMQNSLCIPDVDRDEYLAMLNQYLGTYGNQQRDMQYTLLGLDVLVGDKCMMGDKNHMLTADENNTLDLYINRDMLRNVHV